MACIPTFIDHQLDAIETDAGFRSGENFDPNVLAFEASSSGDPWAATLTYGSNLFDTPLDQNESSRVQIANNLQNAIITGNATEGFVAALNESYAVNYPASSGESGGLGSAATAVTATFSPPVVRAKISSNSSAEGNPTLSLNKKRSSWASGSG